MPKIHGVFKKSPKELCSRNPWDDLYRMLEEGLSSISLLIMESLCALLYLFAKGVTTSLCNVALDLECCIRAVSHCFSLRTVSFCLCRHFLHCAYLWACSHLVPIMLLIVVEKSTTVYLRHNGLHRLHTANVSGEGDWHCSCYIGWWWELL